MHPCTFSIFGKLLTLASFLEFSIICRGSGRSYSNQFASKAKQQTEQTSCFLNLVVSLPAGTSPSTGCSRYQGTLSISLSNFLFCFNISTLTCFNLLCPARVFERRLGIFPITTVFRIPKFESSNWGKIIFFLSTLTYNNVGMQMFVTKSPRPGFAEEGWRQASQCQLLPPSRSVR